MTVFPIKLHNITDLQGYVGFFVRFACTGYVKGRNYIIPADDLLELFSHYPLKELRLILDDCRPERREQMKRYLRQEGILDEGRVTPADAAGRR